MMERTALAADLRLTLVSNSFKVLVEELADVLLRGEPTRLTRKKR
jgi:hypothetical protein